MAGAKPPLPLYPFILLIGTLLVCGLFNDAVSGVEGGVNEQ
jgi:hypothetical protein